MYYTLQHRPPPRFLQMSRFPIYAQQSPFVVMIDVIHYDVYNFVVLIGLRRLNVYGGNW